MSLFIVSMSTTQGPYGPVVNMSYHRTEEEGRRAYQECLDSLGMDPSTVLFVRVDESTMEESILDSFEGTEDDMSYDDEEEVG
jgi:hypothetical protein